MRTVTVTLAAALLAGCTGGSSGVTSTAGAGTPSPTSTSNPGTPRPRVGDAKVLTTKLRVPWGVAFLADGSALVGERAGRVSHVSATGKRTTVGTVRGVSEDGEGGLLGLAARQKGSATTLFAYYTSTSDDNRVVSMTYRGGRLGTQKVLLKGIASADHHNGGALAIGPDGDLWIGTGDAGNTARSQQRTNLNGKVLRITTSGKVPADNPFRGSPVYSYGHRNVQGIAFDSAGRTWATEFGQNTYDELNLIEKGANYGWPVVEGREGKKGYVDPKVQWPTSQASPSGLAIVDDVAYLGALRGERLWQVPLDGTAVGTPKSFFRNEFGRIRTVVAAPGGRLWLTTSNRDGRGSPVAADDRILRVPLSS
ncbi:PQQ-dependent sugar dehydrogenase [Spongisporangium articulatum]|uniref:PQQ-dependent sugar dehydrogenase n=1 Tax=Spongisporangium articulatum TaxID=3362603 RepID=A0ABW8AN51_9ACTN